MKPFVFRQFVLRQHTAVFRVGTDGVLLGALCGVTEEAQNILEIGTGTGLISLMIAQRCLSADVLAIDINPEAVILAAENFSNSSFADRLQALSTDFKKFKTEQKFDMIVSNPPYFESNPSEKDALARQQRELTFTDLIDGVAENLSTHGLFSVIIPYASVTEFIDHCQANRLFLQRKIVIFGRKESEAKRAVLEFGFTATEPVTEHFIIEEAPRVYSEQYLATTKDFHVFKTGATSDR